MKYNLLVIHLLCDLMARISLLTRAFVRDSHCLSSKLRKGQWCDHKGQSILTAGGLKKALVSIYWAGESHFPAYTVQRGGRC